MNYKNIPVRFVLPGVVFLFTLVGLAIRLSAPLAANFPLNDGGLFYTMIIDLQDSHYALPVFTTYNHSESPFAYPPFSLYFTALLSDISGASLLNLFRLLPAFVSGLCIPAFYVLAKQMTASKTQVALAVAAFSLLPRVFTWHIMGGGITRSFGLLFALLTISFAYKLFVDPDNRTLWGTILFGTLTFLSHPEATVHAAITAFVFYLWKDRSVKGLLRALSVAAGILVLSAPWWGTVIMQHGLEPFWASMDAARQNSFNALVGMIVFFRFLFAGEPYLTILSAIGVIGLFVSLVRKQTLIPAWMFTLHLLEPRGGTLYLMIPLALLIGLSLEKVILPALPEKIAKVFLGILLFYTCIGAYSEGARIHREFTLQPTDISTFTWVRENTPKESQFALVTGQLPLRDAWSEWFPVLSERRSQATVFGYEWVNDGQFSARVDAYQSLQDCAYQDINCFDSWSQVTNAQISHIYIRNSIDPMRFPISIHLLQSANYKLVFQNNETIIFQQVR